MMTDWTVQSVIFLSKYYPKTALNKKKDKTEVLSLI